MLTADDDARLVGRVEERAALSQWLREAIGGSPRLVLVSGEPGMGKTSLLRWLTAEARTTGAQVGWGTGLEGIDVPFLAASALLDNLGTAKTPIEQEDHSAWAGEGSDRMIAAVDAVRTLAARQPLVLVLDDLQWVDEASATFAHHLAVVLATMSRRCPVLLALSIRQAHRDERWPSAALRLAREPKLRHLHVGPLNEVEVRELHRSLTGDYPTTSQLRDIVETTGGRPLLVAARPLDSAPTAPGAAAITPDDLLGGAVRTLPNEARAAVETLAILGARTAAAALPHLFDEHHERMLQPAIDADVLVRDGDAIEFVHSLYREAVLHSLGPTGRSQRSIDVSRKIVREPLRSLLGDSVVAAHLRETPDAAPPATIADIRWSAGLDAFRAGAWGLAAEHLSGALDVVATDDDGDRHWPDRPARWYQAGEAAFRNIDPGCIDLLRRALDEADVDHDPDLVAAATVLLARAVITHRAGGGSAAEVERAARALAEHPDPRLEPWRASLYGIAAECHAAMFDAEGGRELAERAREAAPRATDPLSAWAVEISQGLQLMTALELDDARPCFERATEIGQEVSSPWHEAAGRTRSCLVDLMRGDIEELDSSSSVALGVARSCLHWAEASFGGAIRTVLFAATGDRRIEAEAEASIAMYRRTEYVFSPPIVLPALAYARATRGDIHGAKEAIEALEQTGQRAGAHRRALQRMEYLLTGDRGALRADPVTRGMTGPIDVSRAARVAALADDAVDGSADSTAALEELATAIDGLLANGLVITPGWPHFLPRLRAHLAVALNADDAGTRLDGAAALAAKLGLVFESVVIDLIRSRNEQNRAVGAQHAANALGAADRAGLLTGVMASQRRLNELGAEHDDPLGRVVVNTDIVASTVHNRALGDEAWLEVLNEHDELERSVVRRHGGTVFRHTGDGMFAWFVSASEATTAVQALLEEFDSRRFLDGHVALQIRAGVAAGTPLSRDDDLFGITMVEASRLCDAAPDGRALATGSVVGSSGLKDLRHDRLDLKGLDGPVDVYEIAPSDRGG